MLKKYLDVKKSLSCGEKIHYSTIWGLLPHSKFCYQLSQWKYPWLYQKGNLISKFLRSQSTWLCNLENHEKKILYKNVKRYEDIEGLSAAISYARDRLTKKLFDNSIDLWQIQLEKVVKEGGSHIVHLIWRHKLMILHTFLWLLIYYSLIENRIW